MQRQTVDAPAASRRDSDCPYGHVFDFNFDEQKTGLVGDRETGLQALEMGNAKALLDTVAIATAQQSYFVVNS